MNKSYCMYYNYGLITILIEKKVFNLYNEASISNHLKR